MTNEFPITINISSAGGEQAATSGGSTNADAPAPRGLDELGAPAATSGSPAQGAGGDAPAPMPLEDLMAASGAGDAGGSPPSPSGAGSAPPEASAPGPLPLEELQDK